MACVINMLSTTLTSHLPRLCITRVIQTPRCRANPPDSHFIVYKGRVTKGLATTRAESLQKAAEDDEGTDQQAAYQGSVSKFRRRQFNAIPVADVQQGLSDEYSQEMQQRMGGVLTYRHEGGMNYNTILDDLIVGSCPQQAQDVDRWDR